MTLTRLQKRPLQFILFGGKGGVGKTTMASATALELAREKKVLIFSTDPAPSLGDCFGQPVGNKPTAILGTENLFALEVDAKQALEEAKAEYGEEVLDILQKGAYPANEEAEETFRFDLPGLDEIMSLKKITDFMKSTEYQLYIVDAAPTGHTIRLLTLPDLLDQWIKFLAHLRWKYRTVTRQFSRKEQNERTDQFLMDIKQTVQRVRTLLQDPEKTEFVVVTIAEKMAALETEDLLDRLKQMQIPSAHIIVNNLFPPEESDFAEMRRKSQEKYLHEIKERACKTHIITEVTLQPTEIQGIESLRGLGAQLFADSGEEKL